jgi:N-methylhydantoinase A
MAWMVGVDVGGTFTDFYAFDDQAKSTVVHKTPSTPGDPSEAILGGLRTLISDHNLPVEALARLAHGTTVGTNVLIQRLGRDVAVVTTDGFRDLLEIGRQVRPRMYDMQLDYPAPLAKRKHRFEVLERIDAKGRVLRPLTDEAITDIVEKVRVSGTESCAVCLLFSFLNPEHERRIGAALSAAMPELFISLSSDVQPEFREYERFSTAVLNAYLQPTVARYVVHLGEELKSDAPYAVVGINQSSGGLMSIERTRNYPIRTALSGPAAGVVGAIHAARLSDRPDIITLDMGGTSADTCLIRNFAAGSSVGREVAGFPIRLPMVDINTVGAGGGSVAWFERDGLLKVGPASAGADPGPACYGRGGDQATVSDANLILGRLSPDGLLGGAMPIDLEAARRAMQPIAERLDITLERAAHGVLAIVVANMVRAIRAVSVERGHDPRNFTLMPFGGAGALHATEVARALDIREILVPYSPGILCAQGLVVSDLKEDFVSSVRIRVEDANVPDIQAGVDALHADAMAWFLSEDVSSDRRAVTLSLDMRYVGQNFELAVPIEGSDPALSRLPGMEDLKSLFFAAHEMNYGYHNLDDQAEIINMRLTARGHLDRPPPPQASADGSLKPSSNSQRLVWFNANNPVNAPVYHRDALSPGHIIQGPAVIDQLDATTLIFPGDKARIDAGLNLLVELAS